MANSIFNERDWITSMSVTGLCWVKGRAKPLTAIRKYLAPDELDVYSVVNQSLLKFYNQSNILRIEIEWLDARSIEMAKWQFKR